MFPQVIMTMLQLGCNASYLVTASIPKPEGEECRDMPVVEYLQVQP